MGYPKQVYRRAWEKLDARADAKKAEADRRKQEIYRKLPRVEAIEREMALLAAESIYAAAGGGQVKERIEALATKSLSLQQERASLLRASGFSEDYLAELFHCAACRDRGYVGTQMCSCLCELLRKEAFAMIGDDPRAAGATFEGFDLSYYSDAPESSGITPRRRMTDILSYCRHYAENFSLSSPSLLMMGRTGLGKTHLSLAIASVAVDKGFGVIYSPVQKLCDRLENSKFSYQQQDKDRYAQELSAVLECDLLVLDDLGTEFLSSFSSACIGNIINSRLLENRPCVVSTNLDLPGLEKQYSQRMASRLGFSYKVLSFVGEDIRFLMRTEGRNRREPLKI